MCVKNVARFVSRQIGMTNSDMWHLAQILIVVYLNFTFQIKLPTIRNCVVKYIRRYQRAVHKLQRYLVASLKSLVIK